MMSVRFQLIPYWVEMVSNGEEIEHCRDSLVNPIQSAKLSGYTYPIWKTGLPNSFSNIAAASGSNSGQLLKRTPSHGRKFLAALYTVYMFLALISIEPYWGTACDKSHEIRFSEVRLLINVLSSSVQKDRVQSILFFGVSRLLLTVIASMRSRHFNDGPICSHQDIFNVSIRIIRRLAIFIKVAV